MQRGARDSRALHEHGFEFGHGRENSAAADLHCYCFEHGFGRRDPWDWLVNNGVTGGTSLCRNARPVGDAIHLDNDTVDLIGSFAPQIAKLVVMADDLLSVLFEHFFDILAQPPVTLGREAKRRHLLQKFRVRFKADPLTRTDRVEHCADRLLCDETRVKLLERSGGGISSVWKRLFARSFKHLVQRLKFCRRHIGFATHFEQGRRIFKIQFQWNRTNSAQVRSDIVSGRTIATGYAEGELAVPVVNADGNTIHLRLHDVFHMFKVQMLANRGIEAAKFGQCVLVLLTAATKPVRLRPFIWVFCGLDFLKRQHRLEVFDAYKSVHRSPTNALRR